ncbi:MAG TPA: glucosaminidase domain-containing protein, partial [Roseivirga sp.]
LLFIFIIYWSRPNNKIPAIEVPELKTEYISVKGPEDVIPIDSVLVKPILYRDVNFLDSLNSDEAKIKFIEVILPAILVAKKQLEQDLIHLIGIEKRKVLSPQDSTFLNQLFELYKTDEIALLKRRLITHPTSIVLAQAAVESGWGKSRFFKEANNVFGVWSYDSDEPRIAASIKREDYQVYLRKYTHIEESVLDYFRTIARTQAYSAFRRKRAETQNIYELVPFLDKYSERGEEYIDQLLSMIRYNDFEKYDDYQLDPAYIITKKYND